MAYTALEKMRAKNRAAYGKDVGPAQRKRRPGSIREAA